MNNKKIIFVISLLAIFGFLVLPNFSSAQTVAEIQAQIQALLVQIQQLQAKLAEMQGQPATWCHDFNVNLKIGSSGDEVKALQTALSEAGFGCYEFYLNLESCEKERRENIFGESTASAVSGFQEKYRNEILTPLGLKYPTGFVGPATRKKLNSLYGCKIPATPMILTINPTNLIQGSTYTFTGTLQYAPSYSQVYSYLQRPDGIMMVNGRYEGTTDANGYLSKTAVYQIGSGQTGIYRGWIIVGGKKSNIVQINVSPSTQPSITVLSPNGGEMWKVGETRRITWTASNVNFVRIYIVETSGTITGSGVINYIYDGAIPASQGYYDWTIQQNQLPGGSTLPRNYKIRIDGVDTTTIGAEVKTQDFSDAPFSIVAAGTTLTCTDSDGGANYYTKGSVYDSSYYTNGQPYSGEDKCLVETGTGVYGQSATGTHVGEWICNSADQAQIIIYKCPYNCANSVCLSAPSITVLSPNGGEVWQIGSKQTITWKTTLPKTEGFLVYLFKGDKFIKQFESPEGTMGGQVACCSLDITVPSDVGIGNDYIIRISWYNLIAPGSVYDDSDAAFSIVAAGTACTDSDGGKNYSVKGVCVDALGSHTDVCNGLYGVEEYSCVQTNATSIYPSGWMCQANLQEGLNVCPYGCQDGACKPGITVLSPNGGEKISQYPGPNFLIKYNLSNLNFNTLQSPRLKLELLRNDVVLGFIGYNPDYPAGFLPAYGDSQYWSFSWNPGVYYLWSAGQLIVQYAPVGDGYKIKATIFDGEKVLASDTSDASFSIVAAGLGQTLPLNQLASVLESARAILDQIAKLLKR